MPPPPSRRRGLVLLAAHQSTLLCRCPLPHSSPPIILSWLKALVLEEYKSLRVQEFPEPAVGPNDVRIRVRACGVCGSDIHGYDGSSGRRIPPLVMGHEAAGEIEALGAEVTDLEIGDRVTFDSTVSCGQCFFCRRGQINLCDNRRVLGVSCGDYRQHGAFAELVSVPRRIVYKLPDDLPYESAAMIEAVSVAVHAVNRTPVTLGDYAVVVGSGMIGLLVIQAARLAGCANIVAVDLDPKRLELALSLGATAVVQADKEDPIAAVKAATDGRGADLAFEVVGATRTIDTAIESVRKGGSVTMVGNLAPNVEMPLQSIVTRELSLYGSCASSGEYPACIELLRSGAIQVQPLITATASLEEGVDWFQRLYAGEPGAMKVILDPTK